LKFNLLPSGKTINDGLLDYLPPIWKVGLERNLNYSHGKQSDYQKKHRTEPDLNVGIVHTRNDCLSCVLILSGS
jgi:hypothetical protein